MRKARFLLIPLLAAASAASALTPEEALLAASRPPSAPFHGTRIAVTWYGGESHAVETTVYYRPPGLWRQELMSPLGEVEKVLLQRDGQ
jgi:hypothetical protein